MANSDAIETTQADIRNFSATQSDISEMADNAAAMVDVFREHGSEGRQRRNLRGFSTSEVANLTGVSVTTIKRKSRNADEYPDWPRGTVNSANNYRLYSLSEVHQIMDAERVRPKAESPFVLTISNFKGGSGKTTLTSHLAQHQALKGYRVLVIDLDPQGSLTQSFGLTPADDVDDDETCRDFLCGDTEQLPTQATHWPGVDLIPANLTLYRAEFSLSQRQIGDNGSEWVFFEVLKNGIDRLEEHYDRIFIDTPPALSYLTTNALYAGNGIIVPLQSQTLDFASAAQFLSLLDATVDDFSDISGEEKAWEVFRFVMTRFQGSPQEVRISDALHKLFAQRSVTQPMLETRALQTTGSQMVTLFEADQRHPDKSRRVDPRTYKRAMAAWMPMLDEISDSIRGAERRRQLAEEEE